jgi:hypothetical protein
MYKQGVIAKQLNKDKGDLIYWYETFKEEYNKNNRNWRRKKTYSVRPNNLNLEEYKNLLLNKLKDTLEISGFCMDDLGQHLLHATAVSKDKFGGEGILQ